MYICPTTVSRRQAGTSSTAATTRSQQPTQAQAAAQAAAQVLGNAGAEGMPNPSSGARQLEEDVVASGAARSGVAQGTGSGQAAHQGGGNAAEDAAGRPADVGERLAKELEEEEGPSIHTRDTWSFSSAGAGTERGHATGPARDTTRTAARWGLPALAAWLGRGNVVQPHGSFSAAGLTVHPNGSLGLDDAWGHGSAHVAAPTAPSADRSTSTSTATHAGTASTAGGGACKDSLDWGLPVRTMAVHSLMLWSRYGRRGLHVVSGPFPWPAPEPLAVGPPSGTPAPRNSSDDRMADVEDEYRSALYAGKKKSPRQPYRQVSPEEIAAGGRAATVRMAQESGLDVAEELQGRPSQCPGGGKQQMFYPPEGDAAHVAARLKGAATAATSKGAPTSPWLSGKQRRLFSTQPNRYAPHPEDSAGEWSRCPLSFTLPSPPGPHCSPLCTPTYSPAGPLQQAKLNEWLAQQGQSGYPMSGAYAHTGPASREGVLGRTDDAQGHRAANMPVTPRREGAAGGSDNAEMWAEREDEGPTTTFNSQAVTAPRKLQHPASRVNERVDESLLTPRAGAGTHSTSQAQAQAQARTYVTSALLAQGGSAGESGPGWSSGKPFQAGSPAAHVEMHPQGVPAFSRDVPGSQRAAEQTPSDPDLPDYGQGAQEDMLPPGQREQEGTPKDIGDARERYNAAEPDLLSYTPRSRTGAGPQEEFSGNRTGSTRSGPGWTVDGVPTEWQGAGADSASAPGI